MNFNKRVNGSWTDTPHYIMGTSTDTITTPADIYANDTTATVGLKGNMEQSGAPSPQNPIVPNGTGERTGNLFDKDTATIYEATISSMGAWTSGSGATVRIPVISSTTYTIHTNSLQSVFRITEITSDTLPPVSGNLIIRSSNINSYTFTTSENAKYIVFQAGADTTQQWVSELMLNSGSTPLPYEPYGYKIPISSASTTTPVYLGEVETTRKVKKLVLTGEENTWAKSGSTSNTFYFNVSGYLRRRINITICSHYTSQANINGAAEMWDGNVSFYANVGQPWEYFYVRDSNFATVADLKSYLQQQYANGTPVTIWYVLAKPTTGIVNEPLMKIGDYADEVSGISIPVTAGGDTLSVGTTVQPSEVTVNYKGWHPVADVHERENDAWT